MKFTFGDIVIVEENLIGVVVKSWVHNNKSIRHEVYVRSYNTIKEYKESEMERYMVRHKELTDEELEYQHNAISPYVDTSMFQGLSTLSDNAPDWYIKKTAELYSLYYDKYILDADGDLVKIISIDIDQRRDAQHMNRVTDELGNKHFISEICAIFTREEIEREG